MTDERRLDVGGRNVDAVDRAIDHAVREMMHVDPRADLRARVVERIEHPRRRFTWTWMLVPVAAAALVIAAIALRRPDVTPSRKASGDIVLHAPVTQPSVTVARREEVRPGAAIARPAPRDRRVVAAVATDNTRFSVSPPPGFASVDALRPPPPITVDRISPALPAETPQLEVPPLRVPALEVNALPDSPRERHDEE